MQNWNPKGWAADMGEKRARDSWILGSPDFAEAQEEADAEEAAEAGSQVPDPKMVPDTWCCLSRSSKNMS